MLGHIFKTFYRFFLRSKFQLFTIVIGLAVGMVVSTVIYVYVRHELSYDQAHRDADRIFRVNSILTMEGKTDRTAKAGFNSGEALMEFYPSVEDHTQFLNIGKQTIRIGTEMYSSESVVYADSNAFSFFTYPFVQGDAKTSLDGPNKVVISSESASSYFGSPEKAIGQTMEVNNKDYLVTGVYDEKLISTHIPYNIFLSLSSLPHDFRQQRNREYMWITTYNYIKLRKDAAPDIFQKDLVSFNEKHLIPYMKRNEISGEIVFEIEPVTNIHRNTSLRFDFPGAVNPNYLKVFSAVAVLTLFIGLINYVNLSTAKVLKRVREIGIKKAVGASRRTVFMQFVIETFITVYISYLIALVALNFALPSLSELTERKFTFFNIADRDFFVTTNLFLIAFALIASIYPAMLLSSTKAINALRSVNTHLNLSMMERILSPTSVRKALVTIQFAISIFLIIATLLIQKQFSFLNRQSLGFDKEQVMVIDIPSDTAVSNHLDVIRNQFMDITGVQSVSCTASIPGTSHGALTMNVSQSGGTEIKVINTYTVDDKFMETLGISLSEGRFFSREYSTDPNEAFVINEAAARFLGWDDPLNKKIESPLGQRGVVVGVVKDFNYKSLHAEIEPLIFLNTTNTQGFLMIKIRTDQMSNVIENISQAWTTFDTAHPY